MQKQTINLGPIQETLLIPLLGRAEETKKSNGILHDPKSIEMINNIDYNFSKWSGTQTLVGVSIRSRLFDSQVKEFLALHPEGTIVEIGAGLNTRFERLDNEKAHWVELDLPDSMALRRKFFQDSERRKMIAASVTDTDWYAEVLKYPGPYCFVSEAVIIYLDNDIIENTLRNLSLAFPGSWLVTDTCSAKMVESQGKHDVMKTMPKESWFRWKCDDPKSLEALGMKLDRSLTFQDVPNDVRRRMPLVWRMMLTFIPWMVRRMVSGYKINRFHFVE